MSDFKWTIGSGNGQAKLTESDVRLIRQLYKMGGLTYYDIAEKFDVHFETIRKVIKHRAWTHVKEDEE